MEDGFLTEKLIHKYRSMSQAAKSAFWFTVCNVMLKGIQFVTVPVFTRLMPDEEYGRLSIFLTYEQMLYILATWEIQIGAYQKGIFKYKAEAEDFTAAAQFLINILTTICFVFAAVFHSWITEKTGIPVSVMAAMFLFFMLQPSYQCWLIEKRTSYAYKEAVFATLFYSLVNIIVSLASLLLFGRTAVIKYISSAVMSSVICFFFFIRHMNYLSVKKDNMIKYWSFLLRFEGPLVLHSLSYLILGQADRVMIGKMAGNAQAAYYGAAYSLANVISLFQNSINQSLLPWRYQMMEQKKYQAVRKVTSILIFAISTAIVLFILAAPEIMRILFPKSYQEAAACIPPISVSVYFMFLYTLFVNIETYYEKTNYVMYVSLFCGAVNIILNYFGILTFGYRVCAYTTLFSYVLFALGHFFFMKRTIKGKAGLDEIIDKRVTLLISCAMIAASVLATVLYKHFMIRFGLSLILIISSIKRYGKKDFDL